MPSKQTKEPEGWHIYPYPTNLLPIQSELKTAQ